jgi:retron-type reverse transcriptase
VARFEFHLEPELLDLQDALLNGKYQPGEFFTFEVHDPKRRKICAAPFRDRVVHHAVCGVLEPWFERRAIVDSYACRRGKGTHAAIARAQQLARCNRYFLKCDIKQFFASVDHGQLRDLVAKLFKDQRLLDLLNRIIDHGPPDSPPGKGLPIGNLTSQHFANLYLGELDHFLKDGLRIKAYLRYMDDFVLFAADKPTLYQWLAELRALLMSRLRLALKEPAILLAPVTEGIPFLGFRIFPGLVRLNARSRRRFISKWRDLEASYAVGSVDADALSAASSSLFAHVGHADSYCLRKRGLARSIVDG